MAEEQTTINEEAPAAPSAAATESGDLVSTIPSLEVEAPASEETITTEDGKEADGKEVKEAKAEADLEVEAAAKLKGDEDRFDKHPRFVSLNTTNRELKAQNQELMTKFDALMQKVESGVKSEGDAKTETLVLFEGKSKEEIQDMLDENPQKFVESINEVMVRREAKLRDSLTKEYKGIHEEETREQLYRRNYEDFAGENEDFMPMWDSGEIQSFMDKNPGHNAISSYHALTEDSRQESTQKQIDDAVAKAVEAERDKINKNIKAKKSVTFVPAGPREAGGKETAPELQNSKKFGGKVSVLAKRLTLRREQSG